MKALSPKIKSLKWYMVTLFTSIFLLSCLNLQHPSLSEIKLSKNDVSTHIRFLASDELKGRKVGKPETKIAARYIAEQFRSAGLQNFNLNDDYLADVHLVIDGERINCSNVVGYIEGSDTKVKNEYIILCAHYDHLGIIKNNDNPDSDSIYNGARDNAMGTTALIYAANELTKLYLKRSVIFLATTGEENGMLGSKYFIDNCPVQIKDIVFVLNNDGGGFNDTTLIRIGGKNNIEFTSDFWETINELNYLPYPPELKYLFEKGDNICFVNIGIPSITVSPGFNKVDDEIIKYVHKPIDEAGNDFNYSYLLKFSETYANIALKLANIERIPSWKPDSEYK